MNPLKYGQIIRICNDGLIVAKGFTDPNVYYMKQDNQLNNYRDTLFQILPRGTFEIHDEFLKHGFTAGLEQRMKTEQEQYDLIIQSRMNEDIIFGAEVIFRHLDSGYWLQGSYQCSEFAIDAFKLMIVDQLNTQILFRLMPHQKYQKEGQQIFLQEPLLIVHEKTKCKIDYVDSIIFLDKQFKNIEQLDMLRPIIKKVNNQRNEAVISLNSNRQWFIQIHDDSGIIKPYDLCYFQYTANKQYLCLDNQNIVLKQYKDHDITPFDAIWEIQPYNGQYILRHSKTGLILNNKSQVSEFDQNQINNYLINMVPAKFGVQEISYTSYVQLVKDNKELQITKYQQQYSFIRQDSQISELYFTQLSTEDLDYILFSASFLQDKSENGFRIKRLNVQDKRDILFVTSSLEILQQFCEAIRLPIIQLEQVLNENILQQVLNVIVLLINYLSDKDGKPKKNIQKYYKDMMIIEMVMQIIFFISMKNDISTIFQRRKLEKEKLRLIYINTYLLIEKMIKQNQYVKLYISQWLELFLHQAMSFDHIQVQNTLNELLDDNYQAINKFIIPQTLQRLIKLICQKPPHQKFLRIFSHIVVCNNKAIISNQINILNMFYLNQEVDKKFKYKFKHDNQTYILCIVYNCGYKWRTLQQFYNDSYNNDGLQTWNYFLSYISLLSDICLNRNKFGRKYVQDNFTLQILCSLLEQEGEQQESILKLIHTSYIDCQEFTPIRRIARVREWHKIEQENDIIRTNATIKPEDCDLKRVTIFIENYLNQFTEETIEESQLNLILFTVLQVYQTTVRLGFYQSIEQLKMFITNLLIISKCSKEKDSDFYNPMLLSTHSNKSVKQSVRVDQNDFIAMKCKALACEIIGIIIDMETNVRVSKSTQILKLQVNNHEQTLYDDSFWIDIFKNMIHDRNLFKDQDYILKVLFSELTVFYNPNLLKYSLQLLNRIYGQRRELLFNFDKILIVFKGHTLKLSVASRITRKKLLSLNDQNILKATLENQKEFNIFIWRESKQAEESGVIQDLQWLVECLKQQQNEIIKENIIIEYDQLYIQNGLRKIYTERDINHKLNQSLIKCQNLHENILYFIENAINLEELGMKLLNSCFDFLTMLIWNHPENKQDFNIIDISIQHLKFNVGCAEFLRELFSNNKVTLFSEHYIGLVTEQSIKIADSLTFDEYYKSQLLDLLRILCHFNNKSIKVNQLQIMANLQNRKYNNILLNQNTILNEIDSLIEQYQLKYIQSMQDQAPIYISPKLTYLFNYFQLLSILCEDQNEINLGKCKQMHSYEELIDIYSKSGQCWPLKRYLRALINKVYYAQKEQINISQLLFEQDLENIIQDLRDILDFYQFYTENIKIQNPTRYIFLSTYVYLTLEEILITLHILFNKRAFLDDLNETLDWNFKSLKYKVHLELLEIGRLLVEVQKQWSNSQFIQQFCSILLQVCKTIYMKFSINILILRNTLMNSIPFKSVIKQTTIQHTKYEYKISKQDVTQLNYKILKSDVTTVYESEIDPYTFTKIDKNQDLQNRLIFELLDGIIEIKGQGTILHKNQILYSDQLQDVDINVQLNQNHKRLMQTLEQSDVFKIFLEEEFFQVCRKFQQLFRGDTLKEFIKNVILLHLNQPQILDENLKIFFLKLLSRIIIEKNERASQEIDFWTPEGFAPYKDSIENAQNFLESCGAAELICSLLKEPKLEQRKQMTSELLKFGIAFLLGGNTKCQNSILSKLKTDQQNTILSNYNLLLKKISKVVYNNFKIRKEKVYQTRFKVHQLDNLEYYDTKTQTMQRIDNWDIEDKEEQKQEFKQLLSRGFRYLQLLCENNNIEMKNFIRQQIDVDNTIKINTINFIEIATSQLRVFFKIINNNLLDTLLFILDFIIEIIQVPCLQNQLTLCKTTFFEDSCYLLQHLSSNQNLQQRQLDDRKDQLQNIYDKILMVIMSALEGNDEKIYEDLQNKLEPKFLQEIIMQNLDAMNIKTQHDLTQLLKTQKNKYSQNIQKILNVIIISEKLMSRKMNSIWQQGLKISKKEPQTIIELLRKSILKIEIIYQGKRQMVLFSNHPIFNQLSVQTKDKIMYAIKRDTQREKITGLLSFIPTIFNELEYNLQLSEKDITNENLNKLSKLAAIFSILVNTYMVISYNFDIQKGKSYLVTEFYEEYIITVFELCQLITTFIYYVLYLISRAPLCLKQWKDNNVQQESNQFQWFYNKFTRFISIVQFLIINEDDFVRLTLYLFFSLMGTFWKSYYFSLHLLDLISREDLLKNVFQAISQNAKQLMFVSLLGVAFIFVFSFATFDSYVDDIYTEDDPKEHCETLISCMITLVTSGVIGNSMQQWDLIKFIYDTLYFVFFALLFTNIVSGIMIDTFAELRDERQKIEDDKKNMCFICGLDRATLEKNGQTFEVHIHNDNLHYLWNYIFYIYCLQNKDSTEYSGLEYAISDMIEKDDISWYFIMFKQIYQGFPQIKNSQTFRIKFIVYINVVNV
ncbi:hypothetical protein pb186bvf_018329 [Paramecium bursaria]